MPQIQPSFPCVSSYASGWGNPSETPGETYPIDAQVVLGVMQFFRRAVLEGAEFFPGRGFMGREISHCTVFLDFKKAIYSFIKSIDVDSG